MFAHILVYVLLRASISVCALIVVCWCARIKISKLHLFKDFADVLCERLVIPWNIICVLDYSTYLAVH